MQRVIRALFMALVVPMVYLQAEAGAAAPTEPGLRVIDLAGPWLEDVAVHRHTKRFWTAWTDFENRHATLLRASYYDSEEALAQRADEAHALAPHLADVVAQTRTTRSAVLAGAPLLGRRIGKLFGVRPTADIYLAPALQATDAMATTLGGRSAIFVNPWHPNYVDALQVDVNLAHELTHVVQNQRFGDLPASLPPVARMLWSEGGAIYAAHVLYPQATITRLLAYKRPQWEKVSSTSPSAAAAVLEVLEDPENDRALDVFFHAGVDQTRFPERSGYFLGYRIFWRFAQEHGMAAAIALPPGSFVKVARKYLNEVADRKGS